VVILLATEEDTLGLGNIQTNINILIQVTLFITSVPTLIEQKQLVG